MANQDDFGDSRVDQASFDVIVSYSNVHRFIGEASLDQTFDQVGYETVGIVVYAYDSPPKCL